MENNAVIYQLLGKHGVQLLDLVLAGSEKEPASPLKETNETISSNWKCFIFLKVRVRLNIPKTKTDLSFSAFAHFHQQQIRTQTWLQTDSGRSDLFRCSFFSLIEIFQSSGASVRMTSAGKNLHGN